MVIASRRYSKILSVAAIIVIYLLTLSILVLVSDLLNISSSVLRILVLDVAGTLIVFGFSFLFKNSSIYDPYWSVVPIVIAFYLIKINPQGNFQRQIILFSIIALWGIRLTYNWIRGWEGLHRQDWRYIKLAEDTGSYYWPVSLLGIHLLPTLVVFAGLLPCWYIFNSTEPINLWDVPAAMFTVGSVVIESVADSQLRRYKRHNITRDFLKKGLWAYSRHPNYLGEIGFWMGLYLFLWSSKSFSGIWTIFGFVSMLILFKFISIPMMDNRNLERRPGYQEYMEAVPPLLPNFRKRI